MARSYFYLKFYCNYCYANSKRVFKCTIRVHSVYSLNKQTSKYFERLIKTLSQTSSFTVTDKRSPYKWETKYADICVLSVPIILNLY